MNTAKLQSLDCHSYYNCMAGMSIFWEAFYHFFQPDGQRFIGVG